MARRTDHNRSELRELVLTEAHRHMGDVGFARFSSREVAKRIGYSVGTVYNVFPNLDALIVAVNTRTFEVWHDHVSKVLDADPPDRIEAMVSAYFDFASANPELWHALYAHRLAPGGSLSAEDQEIRGRLTGLIADEISSVLPHLGRERVIDLTRSLIAVVHGHCSFQIGGSYALMGSLDARPDALARVREIIASHKGGLHG